MKRLKKELLLFILLFTACISPQKYLDNKDYDRAYASSLRKLQRGKMLAENSLILTTSLEEIIKARSNEKQLLLNSDHIGEVEKALKINRYVQSKILKAKQFTGSKFDNDYMNLQSEEVETTGYLSSRYFSLGTEKLDEYLTSVDKKAAREAYFSFQKSKNYGCTNERIDSLQKLSYECALVIYNIDVSIPFDLFYTSYINRKFSNLEDEGSYFTKVHYKAEGQDLEKVDCDIEIRFSSLDIDIDETANREDFEKEIVVGTEKVVAADSTIQFVDKTQKVTGTVVTKKTKKTAEWDARLIVNSGSVNCHVWDKTFSEEISCEIVEVLFEGDTRAIPTHYTAGKSKELLSDSYMAEELIDLLYRRIASHLF